MPGFKGALTVAVAAVGAFFAALALSSLAQRLDIHLHEMLQGKLKRLFDEIGIGSLCGELALVALHAVGGLKHLLVDKDSVFQRMWF